MELTEETPSLKQDKTGHQLYLLLLKKVKSTVIAK